MHLKLEGMGSILNGMKKMQYHLSLYGWEKTVVNSQSETIKKKDSWIPVSQILQ